MGIVTPAIIMVLFASTPPQPELEAGAPPESSKRYRLGRSLYAEGDVAGAAREFEHAFRVFPRSAKLAFNAARCRERLDAPCEAARWYGRYLALAPKASDRDAIERLTTALRTKCEAAQPRLRIASDPPDASVDVDGTDVGRSPVTVRVAPGWRVVTLQLDGHTRHTARVEARRGEKVPLIVHLNRLDTGPVPLEVAGWIGLGAGVVGLAVGAVFHVGAANTRAKGDELGPADAERAHTLNGDLDRQRLGATIGYVAGAIGVAGGAALLWWPRNHDGGPVGVRPTASGLSWSTAW